jgi:hypothetical protein
VSSDKAVYSVLSEVVPGTKDAWPVGNAPPLPWFVYRRAWGGEIYADNDNISLLPRYTAELYMAENDPEVLGRFEDAVSSLGTYSRRDSWLESQSCLMYTFRFTYLPNTE